MEERRKFPRLKFVVGVDYKIVKENHFTSTATQSKDIAAGGVCIVVLDKLEVGSSLSLKFSLPDSAKPISAIGRIAWLEEFSVGSSHNSKAYDAGVEFIDIEDEDKQKISQFVILRS